MSTHQPSVLTLTARICVPVPPALSRSSRILQMLSNTYTLRVFCITTSNPTTSSTTPPAARRGAILIDFGLGGPAAEVSNGGSPWYIPPEYMTKKQRGPLGDIFALGVTMLWVLQKCSLPDKNEEWMIWNIHNGEPNIQGRASLAMTKWLTQLESVRRRLSLSERHIESVIRCMLRTERRISTDELVNSLKLVLP